MKKYRDDVCKIGKCVNQDICVGLCPPLKYVNGKSQSKEVLLSNLINPENKEFKDYKEELNELAENRHINNESIFDKMCELVEGFTEQVSFYIKRKIAITILLSVGFTKYDISRIIHVSSWNLWRILK